MNIGMLWFDNDPKSELSKKIERAAVYYQNKYGKTPTVCFVHPSMIPDAAGEAVDGAPPQTRIKSAGVEVRSTRSVLPNHFWIGINGTNGNGAQVSASPADS